MPTTITGDATAVSNSLTRTITAATNASPIVVTTSAPHLFATGDTVVIADVLGNTAANGTWSIIKTGASTFSLTGSTGSGAYTSGGTAVNVSLTPQMQAPADGDALDAASILAAIEGLADRTQFLALIGRMQMVEVLTTDTITTPSNCGTLGIWVGCGGGGGAGGSRNGNNATDTYAGSGGGGGGACMGVVISALKPNTDYDVSIGAGGTAGTSGATPTGGSNGDRTFVEEDGVVIAAFTGGGGGLAAPTTLAGAATYGVAPGGVGSDEYSATAGSGVNLATTVTTITSPGPGDGGIGVTKNHVILPSASRNGRGWPASQVGTGIGGGAPGDGSDSGSYRGGGAGAGGGGGAFGGGGSGGTGGNGNNAGNGVAGGNGGAGAANSGAGGGSGGGGGAGSTGGGAAGTSGAGGSGRVRLYYFGDAI